MKKRIGIYAGSFDPLTLGHLDIIKRGLGLVDQLIIAVGTNIRKKYLFSGLDRIKMIQDSLKDLPCGERAVVKGFDDLLVDFAHREDATILVRGIRAFTDFDYEYQIALANQNLAPEIETIFLIASTDHIFINSSLVKEIAAFHGDISPYVPSAVQIAFKNKK